VLTELSTTKSIVSVVELPEILTVPLEEIKLNEPPNDTTGSLPVGALNVIVELANLALVTLPSLILVVITAFDANSVGPTAPDTIDAFRVKLEPPLNVALPDKSVPKVSVLDTAHESAVDALPLTSPVKSPTNAVEVTEDKPANVVDVEPKLIDVEPTVTEEFDNAELGIFDNPKVIVPDDVIGEPESTSIPSVPVIATEVTVPELFENGKSDTKPFLTLLSVAS